MIDLANPSEEHQMLREMIRDFVQEFVEPQAHEYDKKEQFNIELFRELGDLGLLGITVPEEYGGAGLDAVAATIAHEELSYSDAGFALAYLAHSMLFVNNCGKERRWRLDSQRSKDVDHQWLHRRPRHTCGHRLGLCSNWIR